MFSRRVYTLSSLWKPFRHFSTFRPKTNNYGGYNSWGRRIAPPLMATAYGLSLPLSMNFENQKEEKQYIMTANEKALLQESLKPKSILATFWNVIVHVVRFFHLLFIFAPPILLSPLIFFQKTKPFWIDCFVKSIQRAGVVFIKAVQYMSHRRDIIGPDLAEKFEYLREAAPTHSYKTTQEYFKKAYNRKIEDIFEQFDPVPIASGSVSQVYKAKYKGKKVAVKVRHPNVDKYITRDVNLMFFMSYLASFISPAMEIPVSQHSLKRTLTEQIDFTFEMKNLHKFNQMFKENKEVSFPQPFEESTVQSVLVQTFVEGVPVTYYEKKPHYLNKIMARLGSITFFQMLMKNNFIHADCHGGNIFIDVKEQSYNFFTEIYGFLKETIFKIQTQIKSWSFSTNQSMKKLYLESRQEELDIMKMIRKYKEKIYVNLIDVGMVIQLNETDKRNFVNFIKSIIEGRSEMCAKMIYRLSNFQGKKIVQGSYQSYYQQLLDCFSILNGQALADLQGIDLFGNMLQIIRENGMKLDGQFATLLTNMMVLESIAKSIDPEINILKCAFPYFKYVQDFGVYTQ